jgi:hypothetical protein
MYTLTGKAPASSARPGMEVTLYTHTHMSEILRAEQFFSLHYDNLEIKKA